MKDVLKTRNKMSQNEQMHMLLIVQIDGWTESQTDRSNAKWLSPFHGTGKTEWIPVAVYYMYFCVRLEQFVTRNSSDGKCFWICANNYPVPVSWMEIKPLTYVLTGQSFQHTLISFPITVTPIKLLFFFTSNSYFLALRCLLNTPGF